MFKKLTVKHDPENPYAVDLCIGRFRLLFRWGKYKGWYNSKLNRVP